MSQIRGTKLNFVGRTNARSSKNVERSLLATKYAVPPVPSVKYRTPRPMMWLIGMKFNVISGKARPLLTPDMLACRQRSVTPFTVYMAPLGEPVLPDV